MEIIVKPVRKLTKLQKKKLPQLFRFCDRSNEEMQVFAVFAYYAHDINHQDGIFVGAMQVTFEGFTMHEGIPYFDVYMDKFEIVNRWRGYGIGKAMLDWLFDEYHVKHISLNHVDPFIDNGKSYNFWKHMGFRRINKDYYTMQKFLLRF